MDSSSRERQRMLALHRQRTQLCSRTEKRGLSNNQSHTTRRNKKAPNRVEWTLNACVCVYAQNDAPGRCGGGIPSLFSSTLVGVKFLKVGELKVGEGLPLPLLPKLVWNVVWVRVRPAAAAASVAGSMAPAAMKPITAVG